MTLKPLIDELRAVEHAIMEQNKRLSRMNMEMNDAHNALANLHARKARIVVDITAPQMEVI